MDANVKALAAPADRLKKMLTSKNPRETVRVDGLAARMFPAAAAVGALLPITVEPAGASLRSRSQCLSAGEAGVARARDANRPGLVIGPFVCVRTAVRVSSQGCQLAGPCGRHPATVSDRPNS